MYRTLAEMVLRPDQEEQIKRVIREHRGSEKILSHGLKPARRLLFIGSTGTGKTMAAEALASALGWPLHTHTDVDDDGCIRPERAVQLFELDHTYRLQTFLRQFLDGYTGCNLLVAATSHPMAIDCALFTRFDLIVWFYCPTPGQAEQAARNRLAPYETSEVDWAQFGEASRGLSYADVAIACDATSKDAILAGTRTISTGKLMSALDERRRP